MPAPPRTDVLPSPLTSQANPTRGATVFSDGFLNSVVSVVVSFSVAVALPKSISCASRSLVSRHRRRRLVAHAEVEREVLARADVVLDVEPKRRLPQVA